MAKKKIKVIRVEKFVTDAVDVKGMTIPAGTRVGVVKEAPEHPDLHHRMLVVRVDNGVRLDTAPEETAWELCPETCIVLDKDGNPTTLDEVYKR